MDGATAERLLDKVRSFVEEVLDEDERPMFAALLAPGIARAHEQSEVEGFALDWSVATLPASLAEAVRGRDVRIEGL